MEHIEHFNRVATLPPPYTVPHPERSPKKSLRQPRAVSVSEADLEGTQVAAHAD